MHDLADVFDLTLTNGIGVVAQASIVNTGIGLVGDVAGISDGALIPFDGPYSMQGLRGGIVLLGGYATHSSPEIRARGKDNDVFLFASLLPIVPGGHGHSTISKNYATKFVVGASLGYGVKFGFNPGELLDFFLGFFGADIYKDDDQNVKQEVSEDVNKVE